MSRIEIVAKGGITWGVYADGEWLGNTEADGTDAEIIAQVQENYDIAEDAEIVLN